MTMRVGRFATTLTRSEDVLVAGYRRFSTILQSATRHLGSVLDEHQYLESDNNLRIDRSNIGSCRSCPPRHSGYLARPAEHPRIWGDLTSKPSLC
jgi:hypothetical protein